MNQRLVRNYLVVENKTVIYLLTWFIGSAYNFNMKQNLKNIPPLYRRVKTIRFWNSVVCEAVDFCLHANRGIKSKSKQGQRRFLPSRRALLISSKLKAEGPHFWHGHMVILLRRSEFNQNLLHHFKTPLLVNWIRANHCTKTSITST